MNARKFSTLLLACLWMGLSGCQASAAQFSDTALPTRAGSLRTYQAAAPTLTVTPPRITPATLAPLPTASATPRTYTVKAGDDMSGIALRFRVSLDSLKAANPDVNPRMMKVGTLLVIPGTAPVLTSQPLPTATTQPVALQQAHCSPDASGGAWCMVLASQSSAAPVFNLTVSLRLLDETGKQVAKQNGSLGVDLLPPGATLPVMAYFPGPLPKSLRVEAQLLSALPAQLAADRYPPVQVQGLKTTIAPDGLSAETSGQVSLVAAQASASQLRLLLVAYDSANQVAGVRRWDQTKPPAAGQPASFSVRVYSLGPQISSVQVVAEAVK